MSDFVQLSPSPPTLSNFIIPYHNDVRFVGEFQKEELLKFIQENAVDINETDCSFFPRAITELDIDVENNINDQKVKETSTTFEATKQYLEEVNIMESRNYQPDVITSNSHHRPGPDGSPALCPPKSQGFVNSSNLSETGELFAPVRTLTFSDIESSHVEDSYVNSSRLVSTPEHAQSGMRNFDLRNTQSQRTEALVYMGKNDAGIKAQRGDSQSRESSPEFRQLDGEDENELLGTGTFKPSFHGINQEFLDSFTGKTRSSMDNITGDIFSPLGGKPYASEDNERKTPPIHSPAPNSPYAKHLANQGIILTRHVEQDAYDDEIQFQMSPTRNFTNTHMVQNTTETNVSSRQPIMMNFLRENTFQPIDKGRENFLTHSNVPRNLNEYLEQDTDDKKHELELQRYEMNLRQGDGVEKSPDNSTNQLADESHFDRQFTAISESDFEQRYLRRTQVSVKLPQATYDTMTGEFVIQDPSRQEPAGLSEGNSSEIRGTGPEKQAQHKDGVITQIVASGATSHWKESDPSSVNDDISITNSKGREMENNDRSDTSNVLNSNKNKQDNRPEISQSVMQSYGPGNVPKPNHVNTNDEPSVLVTSSVQSVVTKTGSDNTDSKLANQPPSVSHTSQPSSRLFQETISQRNKTNQKYMSAGPGVTKSSVNQSKEFKKPVDYPPRNSSSNTAGVGAKKLPQGEVGNPNVKSKQSERQKSKSLATESVGQAQKQFKASQNPIRTSSVQNQSYPQPRQTNPMVNQSSKSQTTRNQPAFNLNQGEGEGPHNLSSQSVEDVRAESKVVTQVQSTSPVHEHKNCTQYAKVQHTGDNTSDIQGMEDVRSQLQSMLKLSTDTMSPQERSRYEHSEIMAGFGMDFSGAHGSFPPQGSMDMSWNMYRKPNDEEVMENFPSFSSQFMVDSGNVSRSDVSLHAENQRLRDMLEKERYRRKHCEQYIQQLNMKILEIQQQLAVAVSTDKRKDLMIEQLDKQLALVVEGWRKRDAEKDELLGNLQQEKLDVENNLQKQQEMIRQFEQDMSDAVEALRLEREKSSHTVEEMREKIAESERTKSHAEEMLSAEQEKCQLIQTECENLRESRETLDKKLEQMQRRLHREQDEWFQREQELLQRIEEVGEKNTKILQMERAKSEEQGKLAEEVVEQLQESQNSVKKLELELDAALREKESTKVEMGIMEAKFENAQRVLETDLQSQMEKQIADQILDVQTRYERIQDEMREGHRVQVLELTQRHSKETEKQLAIFRDELAKKEDDFRKQLQELETRLLEYRNENSELKLAKQKLESTRLEILTKLQYAMQTQWNEALTLLAATPQRKNANSTLCTEDESNISSVSAQPNLSSINFNLPTRTAHNESERTINSPPRSQHRLASPERLVSNQGRGLDAYSSPERQLSNQSRTYDEKTNQKSPTKEGGAKRDDDNGVIDVETTALSHMREFQDYMNRLAETPEWISALTRQSQDAEAQRSMPQDISVLLSTYLSQQPAEINNQSMQSIPQTQQESSNQISFHKQFNFSTSEHQSESANQLPFTNYSSSAYQNKPSNQGTVSSQASQPKLDTSPSRSQPTNRNTVFPTSELATPPRETVNLYNRSQFSESQFASSQSNSVIFGGMVQSSSPMYEDSGMSRAVAIRPPQQGDDPYLQDDNESVISSIAGGGHAGGFFQGGQCFSPPTRQRRGSFNDSTDDLNKHSSRLNEDYSDLSERMKKHETHQNDLQKYLQMLLQKPVTDSSGSKNESLEQNDSVLSQDGLELNDTAQAAQLQKELDRIQELRERQESSSKTQTKPSSHISSNTTMSSQEKQGTAEMVTSPTGQSKILKDEQLIEITRLLNAVKDHPVTGNQHIGELLNTLKNVKKETEDQMEIKKSRGVAERPKPVTTGTKRNVQFHPGKGVSDTKALSDNSKQEKSAPRSAQSKKIERKIAGSAAKGEKGGKPAAWK